MIRFIKDADEKRKIAREILESLTDWFGIEESREQYIADSAGQPFWVSVNEGINEGFLCLKETGKETMEIAVMGVRSACHRKGIGRRLFAAAKDYDPDYLGDLWVRSPEMVTEMDPEMRREYGHIAFNDQFCTGYICRQLMNAIDPIELDLNEEDLCYVVRIC